MNTPLQERLLTVEEYKKMIEADILTEDDRVELLEGRIIEQETVSSRHVSMSIRLGALFFNLAKGKAIISIHDPIVADHYSMPEPDVALLKYIPDFYKGDYPQASDVLLVIEIADSSLEKDRKLKAPLYASAGIPEYWIVDVERNQIEVCRDPHEGQYRQRELVGPGGVIEPTGLGVRVEVEGLFV